MFRVRSLCGSMSSWSFEPRTHTNREISSLLSRLIPGLEERVEIEFSFRQGDASERFELPAGVIPDSLVISQRNQRF